MKKIIEQIENKAKRLGLNKEDLASALGITRNGLYKMLYINESLKVKDLLTLAEKLDLDPVELFSEELNTDTNKDRQLDLGAIKFLPKLAKSKDISELHYKSILNPGNEDSTFKVNKVSYYNLLGFCTNFQIPFDLFLKEEYRKEYKRVKVEDYIKHKDLISKNNIELKYLENFHYYEIHLINLINKITTRKKKKVDLRNQDLFLSFENIPIEKEFEKLLSSFKISIITQESNVPIVILTSTPNISTSIINQAEKVAEVVFNNYLKKYFKLKEIVWATFQFHNNGSYDIGLVKFPGRKFSNEPEWFDIDNDPNKKEFTMDQLKKFLNYI